MPDQPQEGAIKFLTCVCAHIHAHVYMQAHRLLPSLYSLSFRNYPLVHPHFQIKKSSQLS